MRMLPGTISVVLLATWVGGTPRAESAEPSVSIRLQQTAKEEVGARFVLSGLPRTFLDQWAGKSMPSETWQRFFGVYAVFDGRTAASAMLGDYDIVGNDVVFVP